MEIIQIPLRKTCLVYEILPYTYFEFAMSLQARKRKKWEHLQAQLLQPNPIERISFSVPNPIDLIRAVKYFWTEKGIITLES